MARVTATAASPPSTLTASASGSATQGQGHVQVREDAATITATAAHDHHLRKARALLHVMAGSHGHRGRQHSSPARMVAPVSSSSRASLKTPLSASSSASELRDVAHATQLHDGDDNDDACGHTERDHVHDASGDGSGDGDGNSSSPGFLPWDESVVVALALLQQAQEAAATATTDDDCDDCDGDGGGSTTLSKEALTQIFQGFITVLARATMLPSTADRGAAAGPKSSREVERQMERLFVSHANVFDEKVQNFIIQNFIQETDYAKAFRSAMRRTSLVKRCLKAMYPSEKVQPPPSSPLAQKMKSAAAVATQADTQDDGDDALLQLAACPEITDPETVVTVKTLLADLSSWEFDLFGLVEAVPGQTLLLIGNELLDKYELTTLFRTTKAKQLEFLRQIQRQYHHHPYHNAEHAADVAQTLHHFLLVGRVGETVNPRSQCAALLAAIVHDVGHTSFTNNFHVAANDDLAVQYVYRSPLEHMHCAVAFQQMRAPRSNILHGLSRMEQMEIRTLITDMVLATDNSVHAAYLAKLDALVCRSTHQQLHNEEDETDAASRWTLSAHPDDERLVLQMALHAADVSNPAKSQRQCRLWAERILVEFYQQGDKERELELPVSIGYDRENAIPLEKMQAGFILGIVRPLFAVFCQLPHTRLGHCLTQLDENLAFWQSEIQRTQQT